MNINIPYVPNPCDKANPYANAYGLIAGLSLDPISDVGRAVVNNYANAAAVAAGCPPVNQIAVSLGQVFVQANPSATPPVQEVRFPRLDELMADPEFAAAYVTIGTKLITAIIATVPAYAGSTQS